MTRNWRSRDLTLLVAVAFALIYALFIHSRSYSTNDASRMASIDSLVTRGTWAIDESPFAHTLDRIQVDGRFVSDKPPVFSFLGAGVYALLHHGFNLTLNPEGCLPYNSPTYCRALFEPAEADWAHFILTFVLVTLPGVVLLALAYRLARHHGFDNPLALALVAGLGLGTAIFPYSTIFVNHVPAAASVAAALYLLLTRPAPSRWALSAVGFLLALATTLDLSAGIYIVAFGLYLALRANSWRGALERIFWLGVGALPPFLLMVVLDYQIMGNPLPPQFSAEGYVYEGSMLYGNLSGFQGHEKPLQYTFDLLVGERGVLAFYPLILWFIYALVRGVRVPATQTRGLAVTVGVATIVYVLFFVFSTDNFGGFTFSPRWLLMPVPLLAFFALLTPAYYHSLPRLALVGALAVFSIASTYRGALNPWYGSRPLLRVVTTPMATPGTVAAVLSGHTSFEDAVGRSRLEFGEDLIVRRWVDARAGVAVPGGPAWYFIGTESDPQPEIATQLGLPHTGGFVLQADLSNQAEAWLLTVSHDAYWSESLEPAPGEAQPAPLPALFLGEDGDVSLEGYQILQEGETLRLFSGWRIHSRSTALPGPRRAFVHLLAADGTILAQSDFLAADYATLFPGDLLLQVQELSLSSVPPGEHWLQIGLYDPDTGARFKIADGGDRVLLQPVTVD